MTTITEDYVSFETAKLLKEKGFDEACDKKYFGDDCSGPSYIRERWEDGGDVCPMSNSDLDDGSKYADISAPTLQMAVKWLRIKHNLCVTPVMTSKTLREKYGYWEADIYYHKGEFAGIDATINACGHIFGETPEKVLEEGIKYCLENLI